MSFFMTAMAVNTAINIVATSMPQPSIKDIASYTVIILTPFLLGDEPTTLEEPILLYRKIIAYFNLPPKEVSHF